LRPAASRCDRAISIVRERAVIEIGKNSLSKFSRVAAFARASRIGRAKWPVFPAQAEDQFPFSGLAIDREKFPPEQGINPDAEGLHELGIQGGNGKIRM
jgi:hypothetical protein